MGFVHLHVHTQYSILDGASSIDELFKQAESDKQIALAITDHGNLFGVKEFLDIAKKYPAVKPIVGSEFYVAKGSRFDRRGREDQSSYHLVLLAKNLKGYKNLIKLSSNSYIEGFYYKPRIDRELLEQYHEDIICTSACIAGEVPNAILSGDIEEAERVAAWYKNLFGDDYYLEIQRHETDIEGADREVFELQTRANTKILEIAEKLNIKVIATNDVHFVKKEDAEAHDRLICLTTNSNYSDPNRLRYTKQEYLKSRDEMSRIFDDYPEVLVNTVEIANKVERYSIDSSLIMPHFDIPEPFTDADEYLRHLTYEGAKVRYGVLTDEHTERIEHELETIIKAGYSGYFLIVQDFIAAARKENIWVGPGRGSVAGSVVAYALKIIDLDPLKYGLLFERFLNLERISMPDIDIDFDDDGRAVVLNYVEEKYKKNHVSHVITYGRMGAKSAIRDVARIQNLPLPESDRLAKLIPNRFPPDSNGNVPEVNLENCKKYVPEIREAFESPDPLVRETMEYALKLEGNVRNTGVHACAIIIGADDLRENIPIFTTKEKGNDIWVSQYDGSQIERVGMLKMDFLGLKTLSIMKEAVANIKKSKGISIDINTIPLDDKPTFDLFSRGDSIGTFQFESDGMRKWLRELKPSRFEDLIAMNALYRPGPMDYIPDFVDRKKGLKQIEYDLPIMKEVLQETYGITVYQEQVMLLSQKIAGFTKGEADNLRKAIGKKIKSMMESSKESFIKGGAGNGYTLDVLEKIWRDWESFAEYAFNKSHSTCYAWVGYQTAWLKANYPSEFMAATLSRNLDNMDEITKYMDECKRIGILVLGPDVNESDDKFTVNKDGNIRFGMAAIKGVGKAAIESIVAIREKDGPFESIFDFVERVNLSQVGKKIIESLVFAGAFDCFIPIKREQYLAPSLKEEPFLDILYKYGQKYQQNAGELVNSLFGDSESIKPMRPDVPVGIDSNSLELLKKERELVGMYLSAHPLDRFKFEIETFATHSIAEADELLSSVPTDQNLINREIVIAGMITNTKLGSTRTGRPFASFSLEDFKGSMQFSLFGKSYEEFMQYISAGTSVLLKVAILPRNGFQQNSENNSRPVDCEFKIRSMRLLSNTREEFIKSVTLEFSVDKIDKDFRKSLTKAFKENKGSSRVLLKITDYKNNLTVDFISLKYSVAVTDNLLESFRKWGVEWSINPVTSL